MLGEVTLRMRVNHSVYHLWAAKYFGETAKRMEDSHSGKAIFKVEHRALVTSALFMTVAFLEATINEVFQDVFDQHGDYNSSLDEVARIKMNAIWPLVRDRDSFLEKYNLALQCVGEPMFIRGDAPYQQITILVSLRNALMHAKPLTLRDKDSHTLTSELSKMKYTLNRLMDGSGNPIFPDKLLSAGCVEWALKSSMNFADEFFARIKVEPRYRTVHLEPSDDVNSH